MIDLDLLDGFSRYENFFDFLLHYIEVEPFFEKGYKYTENIQFDGYKINKSKKIINLSFKYKCFYFYIVFNYIKGTDDFLFSHQLFIDDPDSEKLCEKMKGFILDRFKFTDNSMDCFMHVIRSIIIAYIKRVPSFYKKKKRSD